MKWRMRVVSSEWSIVGLAILIVVIVSVGCNALPTSMVPTAAPPVESLPEPPAFYVMKGGSEVEGFQGSYCWADPTADGPGICLDKLPPTFKAGDFTDLDRAEIRLQLELPVPDTLTLGLSKELFGDQVAHTEMAPGATPIWEPDVPAGDYILSAFGRWDVYGDALYLFPITLP